MVPAGTSRHRKCSTAAMIPSPYRGPSRPRLPGLRPCPRARMQESLSPHDQRTKNTPARPPVPGVFEQISSAYARPGTAIGLERGGSAPNGEFNASGRPQRSSRSRSRMRASIAVITDDRSAELELFLPGNLATRLIGRRFERHRAEAIGIGLHGNSLHGKHDAEIAAVGAIDMP